MKKVALITGITGQDGSYLSEFLLKKNYEVHGIRRKTSTFSTKRIDHLIKDWHNKENKLILHYADLSDSSSIIRVIKKTQPDEIYNLAAMSHVAVSFENPESTADFNGIGTLRILEAINILGLTKKTKFYQASTSELYGKVQEIPQSEKTPFYPRSPYAVSKLYSFWITKNYRESYGMFCCNGILFNHESPRRGRTFVTRKITYALSQITKGQESCIYLGNLDAERDWGHAIDYVEGMWLMLQQSEPDDYVLSTNKKYSVREFCIKAFNVIGIKLGFRGSETEEHAVVLSNEGKFKNIKVGQIVIKVDPMYYRPAEVEILLGDSTKARQVLGWKPKFTLDELVEEMVNSDINRND